jgi:electron transfer flavoprotein beta subunit
LGKAIGRTLAAVDLVLRPATPEVRRHLFEESCELYWNELSWEEITDEELVGDGELTEMVFPGLLALIDALLPRAPNGEPDRDREHRDVAHDFLLWLAAKLVELRGTRSEDEEDRERVRRQTAVTDRDLPEPLTPRSLAVRRTHHREDTLNTIVCIKRVPDSATRVRVGPGGTGLDPSGVKFVLNPYDECALEEAIQLTEAAEGTLTAITLGPAEAAETLRTALAMGADEAVLLKSEGSHDGLSVARALADEIRGREFDLVLFGKQAIDDDNMQVPQMVAELLELPCVTVVVDLEVDGRTAAVTREVEGGHEIVEFELPGVIAAQKGLNEPRYPSLKGIMAAKKKPLEEKEVSLRAPKLELVSLEEPPPPAAGQIVGEGPDAVAELVRLLREEAKVL